MRKPVTIYGVERIWKKCECGEWYLPIRVDDCGYHNRTCYQKYWIRKKREKQKNKLTLKVNKRIKDKQKETA